MQLDDMTNEELKDMVREAIHELIDHTKTLSNSDSTTAVGILLLTASAIAVASEMGLQKYLEGVGLAWTDMSVNASRYIEIERDEEEK